MVMLVGGSSCPLPKPRKPVKTAWMTCARDRPARAVEQVGGTVQGPHHFRSRHHCPAVAVERRGVVGGAAVRGSSWTELLDSAPQSPGCLPGAGVTDCRLPKEAGDGWPHAYLICSWWEGHVASLCFFFYVNKILLQGLTPGEEVLPTEHLLFFAEMALKAHFLLLHRHTVISALFARLTFLSP